MQGRPISVHGRALPYPAICAPLVGRTADALAAECAAVAAKQPDIIEWRVDFFDGIGNVQRVVETAGRIRQAAGSLPILFTRRSAREGGEAVAISESQVIDAYRAVCTAGLVDLVDVEMDSEPVHRQAVTDYAKACRIPLVLSFHNFEATPMVDDLVARFERAQALGADVAKIAVMPKSNEDVFALLAATSRAARTLLIPVVSMSMGPLGAVTRANGWLFGSAMTFAVGASSSAPGQMPIEDVRSVIDALRKAQGPRS